MLAARLQAESVAGGGMACPSSCTADHQSSLGIMYDLARPPNHSPDALNELDTGGMDTSIVKRRSHV